MSGTDELAGSGTGSRPAQLGGRSAIVTGAGGGIGRATSLRMGAEGARLLLTDFDGDRLEETVSLARAAGYEVHGFVGSVTDPAAVTELVDRAISQFGGVDILVNCAGILHSESVRELRLGDWNRVLEANLTSVFLTSQAVLPTMMDAGYGRIINVASQLALVGAPGHSAYAASKAGMIAFTKSLAREVSPLGITANCIAPGPIDTRMLNPGGEVSWTSERINQLPLRRIGRPEEVAGTVVLLASEVDGALYTGQTLGPNSGDVM